MLERCKKHVKWVWAHRTKTVGLLGMGAGGLERWLSNHDKLPLFITTHRGLLLGIFGAVVTCVGIYNTVANYFGWQDEP